jgi:hypothetical protein
MKPYATEVEFLRDEVEKCHASMHSQVETLKLLMEAHLQLKKKVEQPLEFEGATMRDYFAAAVVQGTLAGDSFVWSEIEEEVDAAYRVADAMLEERKRKEQNI